MSTDLPPAPNGHATTFKIPAMNLPAGESLPLTGIPPAGPGVTDGLTGTPQPVSPQPSEVAHPASPALPASGGGSAEVEAIAAEQVTPAVWNEPTAPDLRAEMAREGLTEPAFPFPRGLRNVALRTLGVETRGEVRPPDQGDSLGDGGQPPTMKAPRFEEDMRREGYVKPAGPGERGSKVRFPLRHVKGVGFLMTVLAAGTGQVLFYLDSFGKDLDGWLLALFMAAYAEVSMVGTGDDALYHKCQGNKGYKGQLWVSGMVALAATVMQLLHWWDESPAKAITFAVASMTGYATHIKSGLIAADGYLRDLAVYNAELDRRRAAWDERVQEQYRQWVADRNAHREAVERQRALEEERQRAEIEIERERAAAAARSVANESRREPPPDRTSRKTAEPERVLDAETAWAWSVRNGHPGPKKLLDHFANEGYEVKDKSTIRRWFQAKREELGLEPVAAE
jgi:hypothetical protein